MRPTSPRNAASSIRAAVIELALAHRLVTHYTAFVGVDQNQVAGEGKAITIQVSLPLPPGLDWGAPSSPGHLPVMPSAQSVHMSMVPPSPALFSRMGKRSMKRGLADSGGVGPLTPAPEQMKAAEPKPVQQEAPLRWLARSQRLDGSWDGSVERTSAAVLAFVRAGQTTHQGGFRVMMRRAVAWLLANPGDGAARFFRARALQELAQVTGLEAHQKQARLAQQQLPEPAGALEQAASGEMAAAPEVGKPVADLDDLRLAVLTQAKVAVDRRRFNSDLEKTWLAAL